MFRFEMSSDLAAVPARLVLDDLLINNTIYESSQAVVLGPSSVIINDNAPNGNVAGIPSTLQWTISNCGPSSGRDRFMLYHVQGTIRISAPGGTAPITAANLAKAVAFKPWPINRSIQSAIHTIDSASETYQVRQMLPFIQHDAMTARATSAFYNLTPDTVTTYSGQGGVAGGIFAEQANSILGEGVYSPRSAGLFLATNVANNAYVLTNTYAELTFDVYEPVILPFASLDTQAGAEWSIQSENITLNFQWDDMIAIDATIAADWAGSAAATMTTAVTAISKFTVVQKVINAPAGYTIPQTSVYETNRYVLQTATQEVGGSGQANMTLQGSPMPTKLYLGATYGPSVRSPLTSEDFLRVSNLQIQTNSITSMTSFNAALYELYLVSKERGCILDYTEFNRMLQSKATLTDVTRGIGSNIMLSPSLDLGISDTSCNGFDGFWSMQITGTFDGGQDVKWAPVAAPAGHILQVLQCYKLLLRRNGQSFTSEVLSISAAKRSTASGVVPYSEFKYITSGSGDHLYLSGGSIKSFFSGLGHGLSKAVNTIKDNAVKAAKYGWNHRSDIINAAKQVAPMLMAAGDDYGDDTGGAYGSKRRRQHNALVPY